MKRNLLKLSTLCVVALTISSCANEKSIKKTLQKNPDLVFEIIEKNPEKFLATIEKAVQISKQKGLEQRRQQEEKSLTDAINNPLTPQIDESQIVYGKMSAPITVVEYSDFECPYCSRSKSTLNALKNKYKNQIKLVFKHLPLSFHPNAMISAKYYESIKLQSKNLANKFHDNIFENQTKLKSGEKFLKEIAKNLNVNMTKLKKDLHSQKISQKIQDDVLEAQKFNFQGTPGFLLNGIPIKGAYPLEHFDKIIARLQKEKKLTL